MNEDREVIGLVEGNLDRIERQKAHEAACKAQKRAGKRRAERAVNRLVMGSVPACLVIMGCRMAMDDGLVAQELGVPAVLLAVLWIGICVGRFTRDIQ